MEGGIAGETERGDATQPPQPVLGQGTEARFGHTIAAGTSKPYAPWWLTTKALTTLCKVKASLRFTIQRTKSFRATGNSLDLRLFLNTPGPKTGGHLQCHIYRKHEPNMLYSRKRKKSKTSNYAISIARTRQGTTLERSTLQLLNTLSPHHFAIPQLRSNFVRTEFLVYDKGDRPPFGPGILAGATVLAAVVIALALLTARSRHHRRRLSTTFRSMRGTKQLAKLVSRTSSSKAVTLFSYKDLERATKDFSPTQMLGHGGHGTVYKGKLPDGRDVAVKRINHISSHGVEQACRNPVVRCMIQRMAELAFRCLAHEKDARPSMAEVFDEVERIRHSCLSPGDHSPIRDIKIDESLLTPR
ncbi:hypothetical protein SELMODRAFT_446625 [Selaginella moellendorffii]|uniref:Uncharacterized protein n=1 Tax=Selaginella moellendorffii TaxID=88036 RepID=D8ST32_SELML|nr:hypothetical protein SELMODRAFT_446625 [Selaginella moellendorffii]